MEAIPRMSAFSQRKSAFQYEVLKELKQYKGIWWMPWQYEPMKDAEAGETPRGAGKQALIRGCPNGETYALEECMPLHRGM